MKTSIQHPWLHLGSIEDAIAWQERIEEAPDVGYVYVLALSNGTTKLGSTSYFPQRLIAHQRDYRRGGIVITRCNVTRPAFNYREIELAAKREFAGVRYIGEMFLATINDISNCIGQMPLTMVAPADYGQSRQSGHHFVMSIMTRISEGLGLALPEGMQRDVQSILYRHLTLGRATGLSERDAMLNALAVIEAHTGLKLNTFRDVLAGVA